MPDMSFDENIINTFLNEHVKMNLDHVVIEDNILFSTHVYITRLILSQLFMHFKEEKYKRIIYNILNALDLNIHFLSYNYSIDSIFNCMYVFIDKIQAEEFNEDDKRLFKDKLRKACNLYKTIIKPELIVPFHENLIIDNNMKMLDNLIKTKKIKTINILFNKLDYDLKELREYLIKKYRSENRVIIHQITEDKEILEVFDEILDSINARIIASSENIALWITDNPEFIVGLSGLTTEKLMYKLNTIITPLAGKFMLSTYLTNGQTLEDIKDRLKCIGVKLLAVNYKSDKE